MDPKLIKELRQKEQVRQPQRINKATILANREKKVQDELVKTVQQKPLVLEPHSLAGPSLSKEDTNPPISEIMKKGILVGIDDKQVMFIRSVGQLNNMEQLGLMKFLELHLDSIALAQGIQNFSRSVQSIKNNSTQAVS